jgi:hypothetical protein
LTSRCSSISSSNSTSRGLMLAAVAAACRLAEKQKRLHLQPRACTQQ